jgi:uncharacterized glyoxalase superfamily protein PhnB
MATRKRAPRRPGAGTAKGAHKTAEAIKRRAGPASAKAKTAAKRPAKPKAGTAAKKTRRPRAANRVTPYLTVVDAAASLDFYARAFGFKPGVTRSSREGKIIHAAMRYQGAVAIMFAPEGIYSGTMQAPAHSGAENPIMMHVNCPKVDALVARARAAGATILTEPADMFWGERIARVADPDGYVWCFAARIGEFDPAGMPQVATQVADSDFDFEL